METFQLINPDETPTQAAWKFPPLFRKDAKGKESTWQIGFDGNNRLVMQFGKVGGVMRITQTQVVPKAKRSMLEQALQEARHRYDEKIRKDGYHIETEEAPEIPQPMLANTWDPNKTKITYPVLAQPKLDGIRCLAYLQEGDVYFRSRNNKPYYFLNHIRERVKIFLSFLPNGTILDGEFYSFLLTFNEITSIVRQQKKPHPREELISYFIFDLILPENPGFRQRYQILVDAYNAYSEAGYVNFNEAGEVDDPIRVVASTEAFSKEDLLEFHDEYVQLGYEGLIIRKPDSPYKFGRGSNILKYKEFQDEEGEIVDVEEATGTEEGAAILIIRDPRGNEVPVRFRAPIEERRKWLKNPELVLGKRATVRFQELSPDGVWRFPVGVSIRDYE